MCYDKILLTLKNKRGESLMESIVSILVFSILMAAVTTTVVVSLRITGTAIREAQDMQAAANDAMMGIDMGAGGVPRSNADRTRTITFTVAGGTDTIDITVFETRNGDFIAFEPMLSPP
jgi:Tfp pilus assembly protein PilV